MPRNNKVTERVFADIAKINGQTGASDRFLIIDEAIGIQESESLKSLKERYRELVEGCVDDINLLAMVEEIIIQMRCKENIIIESELRLSLSRNYIYARSLFYRKDNQINDIRVVAGKVDEYGEDLDNLLKDDKFRFICITKLKEVMDKEIENNLKVLKVNCTV
jgi:hypothetical protein